MTKTVQTRDAFDLPEGVIYLDGNSLGPLPHAARERIVKVISKEWGQQLIRGWNDSGWIDLPAKVGTKIGRLIGAPEGSVIAGDSTSINLFKVLTAALSLSDRKVVLSDNGNFPTDLYVAGGALRTLSNGHSLKIVDPEAVTAAIDDTIAVVMLTQVDYRTGRLHDMAEITEKAHDAGALMLWDLAHSAGALPVDLGGVGADFAIGCGYKYLNGGPGAPAFLYTRPDHTNRISPALSGWFGHEAPFAFDLDYHPAQGIGRLAVGTPSVIAMSALDAALDVWSGIDMDGVRARSIALSERFIAAVEHQCNELTLVSPRNPEHRGSQVSFRFRHGYAAMQALIADGIIGDFRAPDIMRFGITPLYLNEDDIDAAAKGIAHVINERHYDDPKFQARAKVT